MSEDAPPDGRRLPRWLVYLVILGLYLTLRGYHSFDGDQAYRLPLLLHRQDSRLFAGDPFVQAFDAFNPHRGSLLALDVVTRPLGLSAGLFVMFVLTFVATCAGVDRLARAIWPRLGPSVGLVAVGLVLAAKAGNIGTNHLFEAMVLDRLMAFALGWLALAEVVVRPARGRWCAGVRRRGGNLGSSVGRVAARDGAGSELDGLVSPGPVDGSRPPDGPPGSAGSGGCRPARPGGQPRPRPFAAWTHAGRCLLAPERRAAEPAAHASAPVADAAMALVGLLSGAGRAGDPRSRPPRECRSGSNRARYDLPTPWPPARLRLTASLAIILAGLAAAWYAIEVRHQVRVTVFQPFRMATVARGMALVMLAGRLVMLWRSGGWLGRMRAILVAVALTGDWLLVVVTLAETGCLRDSRRSGGASISQRILAHRRPSRSAGDAGPRTELSGTP